MNILDDGLGEFDQEPAGQADSGGAVTPAFGRALAADPAVARAAASATSPSRVSVDDVLSRGVQLLWVEAVAIVEELCAVLALERGAAPAVPEASEIFLTRYGTIELDRKRSGSASLAGLGRVLNALLSTGPVPVNLRLFIAKATTPDAYEAVGTFASDLGYFAPPGDRAALVRAVYERCRQAPVPNKTAPQLVETRVETPQAQAAGSRREVPPWAKKAAALAAIAVGGTLTVYQLGGTAGVSSIASASLASLTTAPPVSPAKKAPDPAPGAEQAPARASKPAAMARSERSAPASSRPGSPRGTRTDGEALLVDLRALLAATPPAAVASTGEEGSAAIVVTAPPDGADVYARTQPAPVYSSADADVAPPVMVFPHLPQTELVPEARATVNALELVIDEGGKVEQAKLLTRPTRMPDMMILSGAKMWKFQPASRDGVPVKYRTVLRWEVTP